MRVVVSAGLSLKDIFCKDRVHPDHPPLTLRPVVDVVLQQLSARLKIMYSNRHPLIPPEKPLRAVVLRLLYSVEQERILMEQLRYNLPFSVPMARFGIQPCTQRCGKTCYRRV
jgi:hypothetical protein